MRSFPSIWGCESRQPWCPGNTKHGIPLPFNHQFKGDHGGLVVILCPDWFWGILVRILKVSSCVGGRLATLPPIFWNWWFGAQWFGIRMVIPLRIPIPFIFGDPIGIQTTNHPKPPMRYLAIIVVDFKHMRKTSATWRMGSQDGRIRPFNWGCWIPYECWDGPSRTVILLPLPS